MNFFEDINDRFTEGVANLSRDPLRMGLAVMSGGASELIYLGANELKLGAERELGVDEPNMEKAGTAPKASDLAVIGAGDNEAARSRSRGRASTLLSGSGYGQSSVSAGSLSRRTLMGA